LVVVARILYKPVGWLVAVIGSMLAGAVFKRVWPGDKAPDAKDARKGWGEVLAGAIVHGAVFGGIKAAVDRAGATGFAKVTGTWPGPKSSKKR
jgi:Protein of unknown function (DUF4235)